MKSKEPLIEAYHAVYDVKDKLKPGSDAFCEAAYAISHIGRLLVTLGFEHPVRYDAERK